MVKPLFFDITSKTGFQKFIKNGDYTFYAITSDICSSAVSTENKDCKDSDSEEDGEICFHCQ